MAPPSAIDPPPEVTAITDTAGVTLPDFLAAPIESNEIGKRRRKARAGQWGIAAPSDTRDFRFKNYEGKPKAKRWDRE
jgi:aromatic amino acid aminotransferase I